ncbi:hypothetical protein P4S72_11950 [Vibrio sp. PP-XX7]
MNYATALFDEETAQRYLGYWKRLLQGWSPIHRSPLLQPFLDDAEYQDIIYGLNATQADYPSETGVHMLFAQQVHQIPSCIGGRVRRRALELCNTRRKGELSGSSSTGPWCHKRSAVVVQLPPFRCIDCC